VPQTSLVAADKVIEQLQNVAYWQIVLQKSKVAGRLIFREITRREAIADSYSLTRISEVACESIVRR